MEVKYLYSLGPNRVEKSRGMNEVAVSTVCRLLLKKVCIHFMNTSLLRACLDLPRRRGPSSQGGLQPALTTAACAALGQIAGCTFPWRRR